MLVQCIRIEYNIPIPPLKEPTGSFLCGLAFCVFKEIDDKVVECWVIAASILNLPVPGAIQREDELEKKMLEIIKPYFRYQRTCVATYAIERGVTWPFKRRVVAMSRRLELEVTLPEAKFCLWAEDGDVKI